MDLKNHKQIDKERMDRIFSELERGSKAAERLNEKIDMLLMRID